MIILLVILAIVAILAIVLELLKPSRFKQVSKETLVKHTSYPIFGHSYLLIGSNEDRMKMLQKASLLAADSKHGLVSVWIVNTFYTVISDPLVMEKILKTQMEKLDLVKFTHDLLGNGLIFAPVPIWHRRRKVMAPTFSHKNLNKFINTFSKQSIILLNILKEKVDGDVFPTGDYFGRYTLDSICENALGVQISSQTEFNSEIKTAFDRYTKLIAARVCQPWLYSDSVYKLLPSYAEQEQNKRILTNFVSNIIQNRRKEKKNTAHSEEDIIPLLDLIIKSSGGDAGYTDTELLEEMLVVILAAMDTSANALGFTTLMLSRYPDIQDKVYEELRHVFGLSDRAVAADDLQKLTYLDAVIKEALRLYPPGPMLPRMVTKEITLPSGLTLPANTNVVVSVWGVHHNPRYWGPDVEQFRPERFLEGPLEHPSAWMPFSLGPRNCIGYKYAILSIKTAFATLLRKYRFLPPDMPPEDMHKPLRVQYDFIMRDLENYPVRLQYIN